MEPSTAVGSVALGIAIVGLLSSIIGNLRVRSRCHTDNLDISIQKQFNQDLNKVLQEKNSTSDSETSI
jgi:hypothetical protein